MPHRSSRPSVVDQAEVDKYATGCNGLSPFTGSPCTRTDVPSVKSPSTLSYSYIKVATINVRTLSDDMKLVSIIEAAKKCKIDVLAMQAMFSAMF